MNRSTEEADSGQVDANVVRRLLQHVPLTVTQTVLVLSLIHISEPTRPY